MTPSYPSYTSSGKVNWPVFLPLGFLTLLVAAGMAFVLYLLEDDYYYFIITPLLVALPVMGCFYLTGYFGKCRAPWAAGLLSLLAFAVYYGGYWNISYELNVRRMGRDAIETVEEVGGVKGVLGYVLFRCKTGTVSGSNETGRSERRHRTSDEWSSYLFYGVEFAALVALALAGRGPARNVFFEEIGVWSKPRTLIFRPSDLPVVVQAVQTETWSALEPLPKLAHKKENLLGVLLKIEHPPHEATGAPAYVSLRNLAKIPGAADLAKSVGGRRQVFFKQKSISSESAARLFQALRLEPGAGAARESLRVDQPRLREAFPTAATAVPGASGDFRSGAVAESLRITRNLQRAPLECNSSLCLPVSPENLQGVVQAGSAVWRSLAIMMGGVFGGLGVASLLADNDEITGTAKIAFGVGVAVGLLGAPLDAWLSPRWRDRRARLKLAQQSESFLDARTPADGFELNVWDGHSYHLKKKNPDDYVFCQLDPANRRLLLEGVRYRYLIRAENVTGFGPLESASVVSVETSFLVGGAPLRLVLSKRDGASALGRHHMLFRLVFPRRDAAWLAAKIAGALGLPRS